MQHFVGNHLNQRKKNDSSQCRVSQPDKNQTLHASQQSVVGKKPFGTWGIQMLATKRGRQPDMVENHKISTSICSLTNNTCTGDDLVIKAKLLDMVKYEQQKLVSAPFSSACIFISGSQTIGMIVWLPWVHKFGSQIICGIQNINNLQ